MTFLADRTLGKLARWLRMLGYDTLYVQHIDADLLQQACQTQRIVLTRNTAFFASLPSDAGLFISSDHIIAQTQHVLATFQLIPDEAHLFTRCLACNNILKPVEKPTVEAEVPDFIYHTQQEFARCPHCRKIYWKGSHHQNILKCLNRFSINQTAR